MSTAQILGCKAHQLGQGGGLSPSGESAFAARLASPADHACRQGLPRAEGILFLHPLAGLLQGPVNLAGDVQLLRQAMYARDRSRGHRGDFEVRSLIPCQPQDILDAAQGGRPQGVAVHRSGGRIRRCGRSGDRGTFWLGETPSIRYIYQHHGASQQPLSRYSVTLGGNWIMYTRSRGSETVSLQ
jgi:hypothetical protein